MAISRVDISETLSKIRSIANNNHVFGDSVIKPVNENKFSQILSLAKNAVVGVNNTQIQAEAVKSAYLAGDPNVSMSQVMMSTMKSKVAFEGLLVVRNKLLEAYKDIMNMPI
jgi:flagellar hook-basal body complex protein FliE